MNKTTVSGASWRLRLPFFGPRRPLVSHIELRGVIGEGALARRGLSHARARSAIAAAFKPARTAAVVLTVNSPGGSPVQSRMIYRAIRREAEKTGKPVYTFIEDVGASGGYILALAGDEIYADESSIVGSIGVISAGFGFQEAIARLGVERRVHTAGENKAQLDPFRRQDPQDVERLKTILDDLHVHFIDLVKTRRASKLADYADTFTGAFWSAGEAQKRGLIDGTAQLADFLHQRYGKDVRVKTLSLDKPSLLRRLFGGAGETGGEHAEVLLSALEARAHWARFGL